MTVQDFDAAAMRMYLNELKFKFDQTIRQGKCFEEAKKVYSQIKEIQSRLDGINWQNSRKANHRD